MAAKTAKAFNFGEADGGLAGAGAAMAHRRGEAATISTRFRPTPSRMTFGGWEVALSCCGDSSAFAIHRPRFEMPPTLAERLLIIAMASVGLVADTVWMLNDGSNQAARAVRVPDAIIEQRFVDFGGGPLVNNLGTEGDFARAGYLWAMEKRPKDEANCPAHLPAFQRGCAKWLADIRDVDRGWSDDTAR